MEQAKVGAKLKGIGVIHLTECIQKSYGDEGWRHVLEHVSPETRRMLESPVAWEWYPVRQVVEAECAVLERFHGGDCTRAFVFGEYSLQQSIHNVYRVLFRLLETGFLVKKSAQLWRTFIDQGSLQVEQLDSKRIRLRVCDFDPVHPAYCHDLRGSFHASLAACGAKTPEVVHTECVLSGAPACLFEARW